MFLTGRGSLFEQANMNQLGHNKYLLDECNDSASIQYHVETIHGPISRLSDILNLQASARMDTSMDHAEMAPTPTARTNTATGVEV